MINNKHAMEVDLNNELNCTQSGGFQNSENLVELCRLCAVTSDHLIPIFDGEGLQHNLSNKVNKYLPVNVTENDTLPQQLCYHCAATILAYHEIAEGCLHAQKKLLQIQEKINSGQGEENIVPINEFQETKGKDVPTNSLTDQEQMISDESFNIKDKKDEDLNSSDRNRSCNVTSRLEILSDMQNKLQKPFKYIYDEHEDCNSIIVDSEDDDNDTDDHGNEKSESNDDIQVIEEDSLQNNRSNVEMNQNETGIQEKNFLNVSKTNTELNAKTKCLICSATFSDLKSLHLHVKNHGLPAAQEAYQCIECRKTFRLKNSLARHLRIHNNERSFTCHVCGKQFRDSGGLARHLNDVHAKRKPFPCDICGKSFASNATRNDHRRTHTGERPYVCDSCGKKFKSKACLYIHNKIHTDDFPHPCLLCNKKFRRRQELLCHTTTHTGEKNFTCDKCDKKFRIKSELARHTSLHSDEKPFVCNECGLSFRQRRYLNNHIKSKHLKANS